MFLNQRFNPDLESADFKSTSTSSFKKNSASVPFSSISPYSAPTCQTTPLLHPRAQGSLIHSMWTPPLALDLVGEKYVLSKLSAFVWDNHCYCAENSGSLGISHDRVQRIALLCAKATRPSAASTRSNANMSRPLTNDDCNRSRM